jgi:hypothetical protein
MRAAFFVEQLCSTQVTMQMFVACHGLRVLVLMMDSGVTPPGSSSQATVDLSLLTSAAVECIWRVLTTEGIMLLNSSCR